MKQGFSINKLASLDLRIGERGQLVMADPFSIL